ncbi:MAG: hypothetical protein J1F66_01360 [Clostridiales bacterium]|nr:hypothetical protein [Clostridiales bacterium]
MTDEEIYQQIEEYREEANALYERTHEQVEASIVKHAQTKKRRKKLFAGMLSFAMVLVVTLAIVLPIVIQPQDQEIRYNDFSVLIPEELNYNLKEYYAINKQSLLYLDWYEYAEEMITLRYYEDGKESETVYLSESLIDGYRGYLVKLSVVKRNIVVEILDEKFEEYETTNIDDVQIIYMLDRKRSLAKFEYQGYKYYLEIEDEITLDFLLETIESMFNN